MSIYNTTIEATINGIETEVEIEVKYSYSKGDPGQWTLANGDPGYPGTPSEVEIEEVKNKKTGEIMILDNKDMENFENEIIEDVEERINDAPEEERREDFNDW